MKIELEKKLIAIYPALFQFDYFPFECGDGWFEILKDLIEKIKVQNEVEGYETHAAQIKEKYGTLRFYAHTSTDAIDALIEHAEGLSEITCEICGKPAATDYKNSWYTTYCEACKTIL
jgi:hypothetical protein